MTVKFHSRKVLAAMKPSIPSSIPGHSHILISDLASIAHLYHSLWLVSAELPLPEGAQGWLDDLVEPATWIAAGFPQPVTYEGSRAVMRPFRDVVAAALQITRANADGSLFFPAANAVLHRNLLAAYGPATVAAADSG